MPETRSRRRLHLAYPSHRAGEIDEGLERCDCLFASKRNSSEPFESVEEPLHEVALFVERPVDGEGRAARRVLLDLRRRSKLGCDEVAQVIGVVARVHDDMADTAKPLDQAACLRAVAAVPRRDREPDRQADCIDGGVDFGRQAALGPPDPGSFKPPF